MTHREDSEQRAATRKLERSEIERIKLDATVLRGESATSSEREDDALLPRVDTSALLELLRESPNLTNESGRRSTARSSDARETLILARKPRAKRPDGSPRAFSIQHVVAAFFLFALALVAVVTLLSS